MNSSIRRESGVRIYLHRSLMQRMRQWWTTRGLGSIGANTYVEGGVYLMRHPENIHIGSDVILKSGARLCPANSDAQIRIGDFTTIGYHSYAFSTTSITIGKNCLIAPFCYLVDANHCIRRDSLIREQEMSAKPIVLGDDVWLGAGVVVLKGVSIGNGAVVSAGAVVSKDVPEYSIVAGNPAEVVDQRR